MPKSPVPPAEQLVAVLETLPAEQRQELTAWLLGTGVGQIGPAWSPRLALHRLASSLPTGEDSQLVTIRLPAERHAALRTWCADHGFTMAAVVRGLVERFLEDQERAADASTG
jgi:hypothetical protein